MWKKAGRGGFRHPLGFENVTKFDMLSLDQHSGPLKIPSGMISGKNSKCNEKSVEKILNFDGPQTNFALYLLLIMHFRHSLKKFEK